jgi:hypothetical protein
MYWLDLSTMEASQTALDMLSDFIRDGFAWAEHSTQNDFVSNDNVLGTLLYFPCAEFLLAGMKLNAKERSHGWTDNSGEWFRCENQELVEFYLLINLRRAMLASREGIPDIKQMAAAGTSGVKNEYFKGTGILLSHINELYSRVLGELVDSMSRFFHDNKLYGPNNDNLLDYLMDTHNGTIKIRLRAAFRATRVGK